MRAVLRPGVGPELAAALVEPPIAAPLGLASPWSTPNHLASVAWADLFGADTPAPVNRAEAMAVPAVARARHILCTVIANIALRDYPIGADTPTAVQPAWIAGTHQSLSPWHRMAWTVDDLIFFGWSCWSRVNDAGGRFPLRMDRLPMGRWSFDADGRVCVDALDGRGHQPVPAHTVALIPGMHEGILTFAQSSIRQAANLEAAADRAAYSPTAHTYLKQTGGDPLLDEEIDQLVADFARRRRATDGAVGFLNESIDVKEGAPFDAHLLIAGRNAAAVNIARDVSLPADLLDAAGEHSLTYANVRDNDRRAIEYGAGGYLAAISAALSQDGITPQGRQTRFDVEQWLGAAPSATSSSASPATPPAAEGTPTA